MEINKISNFEELPEGIQQEIKGADRLEYREFHCVQEVVGCVSGKGLTFLLAGTLKMFWPNGKKEDLFEATSYGSDKYDWSYQSGLMRSR